MSKSSVVPAVVVAGTGGFQNQSPLQIALYDEQGEAISLDPLQKVLVGFVVGSPVTVDDEDTLLQAIEKIQGQLFNLISRVEALETP